MLNYSTHIARFSRKKSLVEFLLVRVRIWGFYEVDFIKKAGELVAKNNKTLFKEKFKSIFRQFS